MMTKTDEVAVKLDWSRLLGFDQACPCVDETRASNLTDPRMAKLGGGKVGSTKLGGRRPAIVAVKRDR